MTLAAALLLIAASGFSLYGFLTVEDDSVALVLLLALAACVAALVGVTSAA